MSKPSFLLCLFALGLLVSTAGAQAPTTSAKKKTKTKAAAAADSQAAAAAAATPAPTPAPVETAAAPTTPQPADTSASAGTETKKKHHGLFGKVKDVASNKVVQSVAKTAACTMVPGGSAIASAIDAKNHNTTGAAANAAGTATGTGCYGAGMGGMGGMSGMGGAGNAAMVAQQQAMMAQQQHMAAEQQAQQQAMMAQQQAMMQQAMARSGQGASAMGGGSPAANPMASAVAMGMVPDDQKAAACMGLTVPEYHLLMDPPPQPETKAYMKAQAAVGKKVDQAKQRQCAEEASNQMMGVAMQSKAQVETKIADSRSAGITEAPGKSIEMATDAAGELKKGKTAVRNIDWVAGSTDISEAGKQPFDDAMGKLAAALRETGGGQYRIDLYMDQRYDETAVSMFGPARIAEAHAALSSAGVSPAILLVGKAKRDKNPRLELVKVK